jgi:hypothetical protein
MFSRNLSLRRLALWMSALGFVTGAEAAPVEVKVSVQNLAPTNSIAFAPLRVAFHAGSFDVFDIGGVPGAAIISVAEGGSGVDWFPALAAQDPTATPGSIFPDPPGPLLPGASGSATFLVDPVVNPFFTFASMVVPSNDFFIGNDNPQRYRLFDAGGNLAITTISQLARQIWDAGSEIFDPAAAAFVGNNDLRADQNSVVAFNFAELAAFDGMVTGPGYTFQSQLIGSTEVYRISFEIVPVPEPGTYALMAVGLGLLGWSAQRARRSPLRLRAA